ncbi:MAG: type II toxin-antitoxin system RelE/ParE family toxin [bacterium]
MSDASKPLVWLEGRISTPPFSRAARLEAGFLLRLLQEGEHLRLPQSRPMPAIGERCHELRIQDASATWRIIYRLEVDAVVILGAFSKKGRKTPRSVMDACRDRLRLWERANEE